MGANEDYSSLKSNLRLLYKWSVDWQMLFNLDKRKIMQFGCNNPMHTFLLGGLILETVSEEKDLGVMVRNDLKVFSQCIKVVKTANQVLGMIKRTITHKTKENLLHLYKSLVRPHLEYCLQVWRPYLKKNIDLFEGVQRRATKMILGWDKRCYQERLDLCYLQTLEVRGLRGDLIQVFKLLKGLDNVSYTIFLSLIAIIVDGDII